MKILITGAAGFIGSHLAERLAADGHTVRGVDCFAPFYARALKQSNAAALRARGIDVLPLDLAADDLQAAVQGIDVVFHAAAQPGLSATTTVDTYIRNNIVATQRLLDAVNGAGSLRAFVNISTSSVYGANATGGETSEPKPTSPYGVTKLAAEQLVLAQTRDRGFPACSLRLFSVYGPRERPDKLFFKVIRSVIEEQPFPLYENSEHHQRSFTYVADVIDACVATLARWDRCEGEIFNIGNSTSVATGEGIRIVEQLVGKPVIIERRPKRAGDQSVTHANIDKARSVLGYEPRTPLAEGLAHQIDWYRRHVQGKIEL